MKTFNANKTHQAPDDQGADTADAPAAAKRKSVSKRAFLFDGKEVDRIEEANSARYTLLNPNGNKDIDSTVLGEPGKFATMCAVFGFHTKVGNVANTVLNDKEEPGDANDAAAAIEDFIKGAEAGTWAERAAGGVGAKVDRDALAGAIVEVLMAAGKVTAEQRDAVYAEKRQRLEDEPAYLRASRQVPQVAQAYAARVGKAGKTVDDL